MSKFAGFIIAAVEIVAGFVLAFVPGGIVAANFLFQMAAATLIGAVGTLIGQAISGNGSGGASGSVGGISSATRNPVQPWTIVYGQTVVGGTVIFMNEWGDMNKYFDLVIEVASHPCFKVDALLLNKQMIQFNSAGGAWDGHAGDSFGPAQQVVSISHISRANGVVTCILLANIPYAVPGVNIKIQGITGDRTLNGRFPIAQIISQVAGSPGSLTFTYICGGLDSIVDLEGQAVTQWPEYGQKIHMEVCDGTHTTTFPGMLTGTPNDGDLSDLIINADNPWNATCLNLGRTTVFLRLHYDAPTWAGGIPTISFLVSGKYDIYDPRLGSYGAPGTTGFTKNAALCTADYLSNTTWGFKAPYVTKIPLSPLIAAANICDEDVPLAAGGTEKRYTCNGKFDLSNTRGVILKNLLTAMAGRRTYSGGQHILWPAAWYGSTPGTAPGLGSMTAPFQWRPNNGIDGLFNGVKGMYISPSNNYQPTDIPPYMQDSIHGYTASGASAWSSGTTYNPTDEVTFSGIGYVCISANINKQPDISAAFWVQHNADINLIADGGDRRFLEVQYPFTSSAATAQRLEKIDLLRSRMSGTGTFMYNMAAYAMTILDVVTITLSIMNWTGKYLEVINHKFRLDEQGDGDNKTVVLGCQVEYGETDPSIYDWSPTEELTPQGYQQAQVPSKSVPAPPTNLTLESDYTTAVEINGALQDVILVSWDAPADGYVLSGGHIELQYRPYVAPITAGTVSIDTAGNVTFSNPVLVFGFVQALVIIGSAVYTVTTIVSITVGTVTPRPITPITGATFTMASQTGVWTGLPSVQPTVTQVPIVGVVDGQEYTVEIRSVNGTGIPSAWILGSVTAFGARSPLPWQPAAQLPVATDALSTQPNFRLNLNYGPADANGGFNPLLSLSGFEPVNSLGISPAPDVSAIIATVHLTGGTIPPGTYEFSLCALDNLTPSTSVGISAMSDTITVVVPAGTSTNQIVFSGYAFGVSYGGFFLFGGKAGLPSFVTQGGGLTGGTPPATITVNNFLTDRVGEPPDLEYDHNHTQAFVAQHAGVWDAQTTSTILAGAGGPGSVLVLPACVGFGVDQFAGYILELQKAAYPDGSPAPIARIPITSHDAAGNFVIDATDWVVTPGDNVLCRMKVTPVGSNGFSDANINNAIEPGGNTTDASKGAEIWVIDDDIIQQIRVVLTNDATGYTADGDFNPPLTTDSQIIIVYPTAIYDYVGSARTITEGSNFSGESLVAQIPVANYAGQILVVRSYAESVNLAIDPLYCLVRMAFIGGQPGGGAGVGQIAFGG